jgi:hypothetical protein
MTEHNHTHSSDITCNDGSCGAKLHQEYTHSHPGSDDYHVHRPEGAKLVKVDDEIPLTDNGPDHAPRTAGIYADDPETD